MLNFILARAKEPSTYAGLGLILAAAGLHFSSGQTNAIVQLLMALAGVVSMFIPEGMNKK